MTLEMPMKRWAMLAVFAAGLLAACGGEPQEGNPCLDGRLGPGETDVDCGGVCGPCLDGRACGEASDCAGGHCHEGRCLTPACDDGVQDGDESDVDCGGSCDPCPGGAACDGPDDCASGACEGGLCTGTQSCSDGVQNGDETSPDCGGACPTCGNGAGCLTGQDCTSGYCDDTGTCAPQPTCTDGHENGDETDIDCGGPDCPACQDDRKCEEPSDCVSEVCSGGLCGEPPSTATCDNDVMDGEESDVDCGGPCPHCPPGFACNGSDDCSDHIFACLEGVCFGRETCLDGELNGHETDVDCGGVFCDACFGGKACLVSEDCASGTCTGGTCTAVPDTCGNGVQDGFETDVDCGGNCPACPIGHFCQDRYDCEVDFCDGLCGEAPCGDGELNGHETDVDCGGAGCSPCGEGGLCLIAEDCASGVCTEGVCERYAPTCGDGLKNGTESAVDCGGAACVPCNDGLACRDDTDCLSLNCDRSACVATGISLQRSPESLQCNAAGQSALVSSGHRLVGWAAGPRVEPTPGLHGYYLVSEGEWSSPDGSYTGLLLTFDASLGFTCAVGERVEVLGDHVEADCMTTLHVGPTGTVTATGPIAILNGPRDLLPTVLAQGGTADAEAWEGVLVTVKGVQVGDTSGGPGWWFTVGDGIQVADDFGLAQSVTLPAPGTAVNVTGFVKQVGGTYRLVPRYPTDIAPGGRR